METTNPTRMMMTHPSYRQSFLWTFSLKLTWSWMAFLTSISLKTSLAVRLLLTTSFPEKALPSPATPSKSSASQSASYILTTPSSEKTFLVTPSSEKTFLVTPSESSESSSASLTTSSLE